MEALPSHPETVTEATVVAATADVTVAATVAAMEATGMVTTVVTGMVMAAVAMGMVMGEAVVGLEELAYLFWVVWLVVSCLEICCLAGSKR